MAAAVSQLCVRQGSRLLDCFIQLKRCTVEQISPLFHLYFYLFLKFPRARLPCRFVGFFTQYGLYGRPRPTCVMAEKEKSTSESSSVLSTVRERLLAKSAKQSEGEAMSVPHQEVNPNVKQLLREKVLFTSIEPESSKSASDCDEALRAIASCL